MKGIFIVIDGIDGSGKKTQTEKLKKKIEEKGKKVQTISLYLSGEFGLAGQANPYIASILYAADRFESSKKIKKWLKEGNVVIADRYASSNQIHQGGKIRNDKKRKEFLLWLEEMEFGIFEIPKPNLVIYLNMPCDFSEKLLTNIDAKNRKKYLGDKKDIYESDPKHLQNARKSALELVKEQNNWINIECVKNNKLLPIKDITDKIWENIKNYIK